LLLMQDDPVRTLALVGLAVVALFGGYKAVVDLMTARRDATVRPVLQAAFDRSPRAGLLHIGRFAHYDHESAGSCIEFTLLDRSRRTVGHGAALVRQGKIVHVYPSFAECAVKTSG
jgi:hypothetical protein